MSRRVISNQLASEIMNTLREYKEVTDDVVKQAVNTVSEETKKWYNLLPPQIVVGTRKGGLRKR